MSKILIYSSLTSARLTYILAFFWNDRFILTDDMEVFTKSSLPKICYATQNETPNAIHITPQSILAENNITDKNLVVESWDNLPIFFYQNKGTIPFDLFAATFYLLSRYEEYLPHEKDKYGRYAVQNSIAFRNNFLEIPIVDFWFDRLETLLSTTFTDYTRQLHTFQYQPTFDIDVPFAYLHKTIKTQIGGIGKNILSLNVNALYSRAQVLLKKKKDPYDNFQLLESEIERYHFDPIFFFPVAEKHGLYDKNPPQNNIAFQSLIQHISATYQTGLHPSWQSGDSEKRLSQEKTFLESQTKFSITKSRQHYIRLTIPQTYRSLISLGIDDDYSIGYGEINGFRAGTSRPFFWYDVENEKQTSLLLHPFCWMDATDYQAKCTPKQTWENLLHFIKVIRQVNGQMITIMHNNYFAPTPDMIPHRQIILDFWNLVACNKV